MGVIVLVRHGQASLGVGDVDRLSVNGGRQLRAVGAELHRRGLDVGLVAHGGLRRQRQSAEVLARAYADARTAADAGRRRNAPLRTVPRTGGAGDAEPPARGGRSRKYADRDFAAETRARNERVEQLTPGRVSRRILRLTPGVGTAMDLAEKAAERATEAAGRTVDAAGRAVETAGRTVDAAVDAAGRTVESAARAVEGVARIERSPDTEIVDIASTYPGQPPMRQDPRWDEYDHRDLLVRLRSRYRSQTVLAAEMAQTLRPGEAFQDTLDEALRRWTEGRHDGEYREPFREYTIRVRRAIDALIADRAGDDATVVVSSAGTISAVCAGILGLGADGWMGLNRVMAHGAITTLATGPRGLALQTFNEHAFIDADA
ncbi:MAG: histidine phosphatase family protein [Solirubrobacteraceae bacterium]|nr:histidine phosphatase family protein [Solirubrobacteraceae bacterium]